MIAGDVGAVGANSPDEGLDLPEIPVCGLGGASPRRTVSADLLEIGTTDATVFEALFIRGVTPPPDLRIALLGIGVDLDALELRYSSVQWIASIDLARSYLFPNAPSVDEAERELGRKFLSGFLRTMSGRLLGAVLPFMTPEAVVQRWCSACRGTWAWAAMTSTCSSNNVLPPRRASW